MILTIAEVHPSLVGKGGNVVFVNECVRDEGQFDFDVLWSIKGYAKVEVLDFKTYKFGVGHRNGAVEE